MTEEFVRLRNSLVPVCGEGEARAVAFLVMEELAGLTRTDIYAGKGSQFSEETRKRFDNICEALVSGVPVQYALGTAWFCGRRFRVTPDVLIPRPETEELVAWAVDVARSRGGALRILDAGTGSGCIAVSLKLALPEAQVEAWDVSEGALAVAKENAASLGAEVHFSLRDMLQPWPEGEEYDLVVSNPPYICERERAEMERHVLDHEPSLALFVPDADPLLFYRALAEGAVRCLRPGGRLLVETNRAYADATAELFTKTGLKGAEVRVDAYGNARMCGGTNDGGEVS